MRKLEQDKLVSRKEIVIPITLKGLWNGLEKIFVTAPNKGFEYVTRKSDSVAQWLLTGKAAIVTMPVGVMLRNGSRVAHGAANLEGGFWSRASTTILGTVGAGAAWYYSGTALYGTLMAKAAVAGTVGKIGAFIGAGVLAVPAVLPGFTVGIIGGALALGVAATVVSVVPALVNLPVAAKRMKDAWSGVKYDDKVLQDALSEDGLQRAYDARRNSKVINAFYSLPEEKQTEVYNNLTERFRAAAEYKAQQEARAAAAAKPAAAKVQKV